MSERDENGPYADFYDFCERVNTGVLNKRTIESLVKAGGFDSMGHPRQGLLTVFEQIVDQTVAKRKEHDMGVMSLFGELEDGPAFDDRIRIPDLEFDKKQRLVFEKEMLGLYVSDHPLLGAEAALRRKVDCTLAELADADDGAQRTIGGVITGLQRKWTKKGDLMAVFQLEDLQGTIEAMVFPKTMAAVGHLLADDAVVIVSGRVDKREDTPKFIPPRGPAVRADGRLDAAAPAQPQHGSPERRDGPEAEGAVPRFSRRLRGSHPPRPAAGASPARPIPGQHAERARG